MSINNINADPVSQWFFCGLATLDVATRIPPVRRSGYVKR